MKINNNLDKLRDEMLNAHLLAGYSSHTIKRFKEAFKRIGRDIQSGNCATYEDVFWKHYGDKSKAVERGGRWVLGAIEYFDSSGQLPGGVRRSKIGKITKFDLLSEEFKSMLSYYKKAEMQRGIKASTINVCFYGGISFFTALQSGGITEPSQITAKSPPNRSSMSLPIPTENRAKAAPTGKTCYPFSTPAGISFPMVFVTVLSDSCRRYPVCGKTSSI